MSDDRRTADRLLVEARDAMEASEDAMTVYEVEAQHQAAAYAFARLDRAISAGGPLPTAWLRQSSDTAEATR